MSEYTKRNGSFRFKVYHGSTEGWKSCTASVAYTTDSEGNVSCLITNRRDGEPDTYTYSSQFECVYLSGPMTGETFHFVTESITELTFKDVGVDTGTILFNESGRMAFGSEPSSSADFNYAILKS